MTALMLCACGLAKHTVTVVTDAGEFVLLECEHCDRPCTERRCEQCRALSRSGAAS